MVRSLNTCANHKHLILRTVRLTWHLVNYTFVSDLQGLTLLLKDCYLMRVKSPPSIEALATLAEVLQHVRCASTAPVVVRHLWGGTKTNNQQAIFWAEKCPIHSLKLYFISSNVELKKKLPFGSKNTVISIAIWHNAIISVCKLQSTLDDEILKLFLYSEWQWNKAFPIFFLLFFSFK